jgi:GAF domain-containing protein/HAMP domain-containing protein
MRSKRKLGNFLSRLSLRSRLYVGLGALVFGLLIAGGAGVLGSLVTQNMVNRSLLHHREVSEMTLQIDRGLLQIHSGGTAFYEKWHRTILPVTSQSARQASMDAETTVGALQQQLAQAGDQARRLLELETNTSARTYVERLISGLAWYEESLVELADFMDQLRNPEGGEVDELNRLLEEIQRALAHPRLAPLQLTVWQIQQNQRDFLTLQDIAFNIAVEESLRQLRREIANVESDLLSSEQASNLNALIDEYETRFRVAGTLTFRLQQTRSLLSNQLDLAETMIRNLEQHHRSDLGQVLGDLRRIQRTATLVIIVTSLAILTAATAIGVTMARQVIRPIQRLGDTASKLGAGNLAVRAPVTGQDEISQTASAFNMMADRLQELLTELEAAVAARTEELQGRTGELEAAHRQQIEINQLLEQTVAQSQRRAGLLHASGQVSRAISRLHELDELLPALASLISDHFNVYHAGIFLLDETRRWAVLRASNSKGGQKMVRRNHKLAVGAEGIVGYVTGSGEPRIALDVGADTVHLDTPELPETRSEVAIPLWMDDEIIGALDLQSTGESAFGAEDLAALSGLAEQISIALQNARLFHQAQEAIATVEAAQQRYLEKVWSEYVRLEPVTSVEYAATSLQPADSAQALPELDLAVKHRVPVANRSNGQSDPQPALAAPIVFRNQVIGAIGLQEIGVERQWTPDEIALLQEVAAQIGLALENGRLFQQTERRAQREAMVGQIVARIRQRSDVEGIMQTAVRELGKALRSPHTFIRLATSLETVDTAKGDRHED